MTIRIRKGILLLAIASLLAVPAVMAQNVTSSQAPTTLLTPKANASFKHYTFALTWEPGFCSAVVTCQRQPHQTIIGIHGLWPSRSESLIRRNISAPTFWRHGCDLLHHSSRSPDLSKAILDKLHNIMPQPDAGLIKHEYNKHAQCYGFNANAYFAAALTLHKRFVASDFARTLRMKTGSEVSRESLIHQFMQDFHTPYRRALSLQCHTDSESHRVVLTQMYITFRAGRLNDFPNPTAFMESPLDQNTCPTTFLVPSWPSS